MGGRCCSWHSWVPTPGQEFRPWFPEAPKCRFPATETGMHLHLFPSTLGDSKTHSSDQGVCVREGRQFSPSFSVGGATFEVRQGGRWLSVYMCVCVCARAQGAGTVSHRRTEFALMEKKNNQTFPRPLMPLARHPRAQQRSPLQPACPLARLPASLTPGQDGILSGPAHDTAAGRWGPSPCCAHR